MCGHVGLAGKLELRDEATMKRLLIYDFFRGPDSTGFAALRNNGEAVVAKIASHPFDLFDSKRFTEALSAHNSRVFLGHNRAATKGVVNGNNAHPFEYGHIVGAHNGTLTAASMKELEALADESFDVDSQAIFACIAKVGIEETVKHLQGAWALVWFDLDNNTLNFLRNKERTFWFAYNEDFNKVFWASEWPMIRCAVDLSPIKYELHRDKEGYCFFSSVEDWWYRFDLDDLCKGFKSAPKPRVKMLKGKEPAPVVTYGAGHNSPFHYTNNTKTTHSTTKSHGTTGTPSNVGNVLSMVVHLTGSSDKPMADYISKTRYEQIINTGCSWCSDIIDTSDIGVVVYEEQEMVLCPTCSGVKDHSRVYVTPSKMALVS